jgi:hypothetical protein
VCGTKLQDALLHAIKEEYVEAVEVLLEWEEQNHKPGERYVNINLQFAHAPRSNQKGLLRCKYKHNTRVLAELGGGGPGAVDVHPGHHSADAGGALQQLRNHQNSARPRGNAAGAARREVLFTTRKNAAINFSLLSGQMRLRRLRAVERDGLAAALAGAHQRVQSPNEPLVDCPVVEGPIVDRVRAVQ